MPCGRLSSDCIKHHSVRQLLMHIKDVVRSLDYPNQFCWMRLILFQMHMRNLGSPWLQTEYHYRKSTMQPSMHI